MSDQMMKLADAYTRIGRNGNVYQVAYLAHLKLLIFPVHDPQPDGPSHTLFLVPRPPRQDHPSRDTERGQASAEAVQERADNWSEKRRAEYTQQLAAKLQLDEEIPF
jgi:hypothetical protein